MHLVKRNRRRAAQQIIGVQGPPRKASHQPRLRCLCRMRGPTEPQLRRRSQLVVLPAELMRSSAGLKKQAGMLILANARGS